MIFWAENSVPQGKQFESDQMSEALKFSESLRQRKFQGADIGFVTLASENPNCVGKQGVDVTGPDYDWKKRRI
jgi:hypothetical protein